MPGSERQLKSTLFQIEHILHSGVSLTKRNCQQIIHNSSIYPELKVGCLSAYPNFGVEYSNRQLVKINGNILEQVSLHSKRERSFSVWFINVNFSSPTYANGPPKTDPLLPANGGNDVPDCSHARGECWWLCVVDHFGTRDRVYLRPASRLFLSFTSLSQFWPGVGSTQTRLCLRCCRSIVNTTMRQLQVEF